MTYDDEMKMSVITINKRQSYQIKTYQVWSVANASLFSTMMHPNE